MIVKLIFGRGYINCTSIESINCPNRHGGIGDATVCGSFWTGEVWLSSQSFQFHWGNVVEIQTRSNEDETDEPWITIWEAPSSFSYESWINAARAIAKVGERKVEALK